MIFLFKYSDYDFFQTPLSQMKPLEVISFSSDLKSPRHVATFRLSDARTWVCLKADVSEQTS